MEQVKSFAKKYNLTILIISLIVNVVFTISYFSSDLKKNAFCADYKEQASKRIETYYSDGTIDNIYPDEIFYSKKQKSCIAVWSGYQVNPAGNGYTVSKVIFDAITNKNIFSDTVFRFNDPTLNNSDMNTRVEIVFDETLEELR